MQMYIRDQVSSVTRPVKELKGFSKISLKPGEKKTVIIDITPEKLSFYDIDMNWFWNRGISTSWWVHRPVMRTCNLLCLLSNKAISFLRFLWITILY